MESTECGHVRVGQIRCHSGMRRGCVGSDPHGLAVNTRAHRVEASLLVLYMLYSGLCNAVQYILDVDWMYSRTCFMSQWATPMTSRFPG